MKTKKTIPNRSKVNFPKLCMWIMYSISCMFILGAIATMYVDIWDDTYEFEVFVYKLYGTLLLSVFISLFTGYAIMGYVMFIQKKKS